MNGWKRFVIMAAGIGVSVALYTHTRAQDAPVTMPASQAVTFPQPGPLLTPGTQVGTDAATLSRTQRSQVSIEFFGTVEVVGVSSIVINGVEVEGAPVSRITQGMNVRVVALAGADGRLTAQEIQLLAPALPPGIVRLSGLLSAYNGDFIVLMGETGMSQIIDINSTALDFSQARIGERLVLFAVAVEANRWRGLSVDTASASAASDQLPYLLGPVADSAVGTVSPMLPSPNAVPTPGLPATTDAPRGG